VLVKLDIGGVQKSRLGCLAMDRTFFAPEIGTYLGKILLFLSHLPNKTSDFVQSYEYCYTEIFLVNTKINLY
jgi:hypothetical protein